MQTYSIRARLSLIGLAIGAALLALLLAGYGLASAATAAGVVRLTPASAAQTGQPDQVVSYTLRVTNTGALTDIFTLTVSGNHWSTGIFVFPGTVIIPNTEVLVSLNPGEGRNLQVAVHIPFNVVGHDVAVIKAQSTLSPTDFATSTLTTTVQFKIWLPVFERK